MKKTIGLNPLEEYLSSNKDPQEKKKKAQVKSKKAVPIESVKSAPVQEVQKTDKEPQVQAVSVEGVPGAEVDVQGQLAIEGTLVAQEEVKRPAKQRITLHISAELVDRVKNAVYWEPGLTVAGFAEEAFTDAINALEEERGAPFPQRKQHRLRGGRPVS